MAEAARAVVLYRPSSGTEGIAFQTAWCSKCKRDALWNGTKTMETYGDADLCKLIADSMAFRIDEPGYPQEWVRDQAGAPRCLAFEPIDKPERCQNTVDMFSGQKG